MAHVQSLDKEEEPDQTAVPEAATVRYSQDCLWLTCSSYSNEIQSLTRCSQPGQPSPPIPRNAPCEHWCSSTLAYSQRRGYSVGRLTSGGVLSLNWTNVCSPEHTSDTSTNYDSFLNWTFSSPNMVRTVQTLLHSQLACNEMQASARTCGRRAADSMIENVG